MNKLSLYDVEIENARKFRKEGNEGKARVCARRAVGAVIRAGYDQNNTLQQQNAMNLIRIMLEDGNLPMDVVAALEALIQRVTPQNEQDDLPDLIACAEIVATYTLAHKFNAGFS